MDIIAFLQLTTAIALAALAFAIPPIRKEEINDPLADLDQYIQQLLDAYEDVVER